MEYEITWVDPSLVVCRPSGVAAVKGYEEILRTLVSSPEFGPHVKMLMDIRALDVSSLSATEMEELANLRARIAGDSKARAAIVVGSGARLKFGLGRMFEAYLESQVEFEVWVFEEFDEAMAWLQSADEDSASPAP